MSTIDWNAIKARHRLTDVAHRTGFDVAHTGRVMVCCPTPGHDDRTPSLQLDLDRDHYHCFGCGVHGDVIDWVRDIEGVDTPNAVAILESGRAINAVVSAGTSRRSWTRRRSEPPDLDRTPLQRIVAANETAWAYYSYGNLHERGAEYLASRGIAIAALEAETHGPVVGHTPSARTRIDGLFAALTSRGFTETELLDAGLATRLADGCVIDFHRDRVVVPVRDGDGVVVGLLGRDITGTSPVKYLNPATTAAYQKSRSLYRPSEPALVPDASIVVCEGPLDALAIAAQAAASGVSARFAPVAACGRTLFDSQLDQILAVHPGAPVLAGDGDAPGRQANIDWARRMLAKGRETVITEWPDGYDPATWLKTRGPEGLWALTRRGCLDDHSGRLRPRHCGAVLTESDFPDHDRYHQPGRAQLSDALAKATAEVPEAARRRYLAAAASVFSIPVHRPTRASPDFATSSPYLQTASSERTHL
jgi:DNA primase